MLVVIMMTQRVPVALLSPTRPDGGINLREYNGLHMFNIRLKICGSSFS